MAEYNPKILIADSIATPTIKQVPVQATNWIGSDETVPAFSRMGISTTNWPGDENVADENVYAFDLVSDNWS